MFRLLGTALISSLAIALMAPLPAVAQTDTVLAPSAQPTGCIFATGAKGLAPLPPGCTVGKVSGEPVFTPDGQTLYTDSLPADVLSRDPATGALMPLSCNTPSGGSRCPGAHTQLLVAPDGRFVYVQRGESTIEVFSRAADGGLSRIQCLSEFGATDGCDAVLPGHVSGIAMSSDASRFYVAGGISYENDDFTSATSHGILLGFARDPGTGRLTMSDCLSEVDRTGCTTDPWLEGPSIVATVGQDLYVDTYSGMIGFRPEPQTGRLLENRCRGWATSAPRCPVSTDSPGLRPVVPSPDGRWLYGSNGGSITAWPRDPATGLLGKARCVGPWCRAEGEYASLAVSPDGRTLVATTWHGSTDYGNHDAGGRNVPGDGRDSAVFTFRVTGDGTVRYIGCVGNLPGCAGPFGDAVTAVYPPSGPGPYLMGKRDDQKRDGIQLLAEAPTVSFAAISLQGPNPASVSCPAGRTQPCRGTVELSRLVYLGGGDGGAYTPKVRRLRSIRYQAAPGASEAISLRLPSGTRAGLRKVIALNHPYRGVTYSVGFLVEVVDATGQTLPTGATVCLHPNLRGLPCAY